MPFSFGFKGKVLTMNVLCPESPRLLQGSFPVFHEGLEKAAIADEAAETSFASILKAQAYRLDSGGCT